jgi:esterase
MTDEEDIELKRLAARLAGLDIAEFVTPRSAQVILGGMRFHYLDWGGEGKRPILFLHGGGLNAHTYDLVCLALRSEYHCLALDQRGHGDSEWSPVMDYGFAAHAADIAAFVEDRKLEGFVLVGMSMGGMNALAYAPAAKTLAGIVLIDIGPEFRTSGAERIREFTSEAAELDSIEEYVDRALRFNHRRDPDILRRSLRYNLRQLPSGKWTWKYDRRHHGSTSRARHAELAKTLWSNVDAIACPALVVRGGESDVFSDADAAKLAARFRHGRWTKVEGAGHTVQGDKPAELVVALREFLSGLSDAYSG